MRRLLHKNGNAAYKPQRIWTISNHRLISKSNNNKCWMHFNYLFFEMIFWDDFCIFWEAFCFTHIIKVMITSIHFILRSFSSPKLFQLETKSKKKKIKTRTYEFSHTHNNISYCFVMSNDKRQSYYIVVNIIFVFSLFNWRFSVHLALYDKYSSVIWNSGSNWKKTSAVQLHFARFIISYQ